MRNKYTRELITEAVKDQLSWAGVCRKIGIRPATGSQAHLKKRAVEFGVDTSHFLGMGHNKGKTFERIPLEHYLVKGSTAKSHSLRIRLINEGYKEARCEKCKRVTWNGEPIPLELDHINSDHWDNRLENLQVVCPNCHAQETIRRRR